MGSSSESGFLRAGARSVFIAALAAPVAGQVTARVSVGAGGVQTDSDSYYPSISANGRYVAFWSHAANLVPNDSNGADDIFVRDRRNGATERMSVGAGASQANADSYEPSISTDGRYVAFRSWASNLVAGDTNGHSDVFVRDRFLGTTERVSVDAFGTQGNADSYGNSISADGRYVAFDSYASNLVPADGNASLDVFIRDRQLGTTERVSVDSGGLQGNGDSYAPSISTDGRYVAFQSFASDLVPGDTNGFPDVFVRDRQTGATERLSVSSGGAQGDSDSGKPSISADGRYVAFHSFASNLVAGDTNLFDDVFVRDRLLGTTERVSVGSGGEQGSGLSYWPSISAHGRYVAFTSLAPNLVSGNTNASHDVFVHDRHSGATERVSVDSAGAQGDSTSIAPSITPDGRCVAYYSRASNLVPSDTNSRYDIFVRDRDGRPEFTSRCDPGVGGVIACPCANPPAGAGRGCDNSSGSGGAILAAAGGTYLSSDSLVFTTSGENSTALSIVTQWTGGSASGVVFGQGVRCTSGSLKRLFTKMASGGSITAPDFAAGDPTVSSRSAALGDAILPGHRRWNLVLYRDPNVLGGCPPISTFNATQTGEVAWLP